METSITSVRRTGVADQSIGLGRKPNVAGLDLMELVDRRQLILMTATESEEF